MLAPLATPARMQARAHESRDSCASAGGLRLADAAEYSADSLGEEEAEEAEAHHEALHVARREGAAEQRAGDEAERLEAVGDGEERPIRCHQVLSGAIRCNHMAITRQPHGNHGNHLSVTARSGKLGALTWQSHGNHMAITCR